MLFFLYFFIGHLIGDFLLQTSLIVKWKFQSYLGILLHVLLVFAGTAFMFIPYWNSGWVWWGLIINALYHFVIDSGKVWYDQKYKPKSPMLHFWIDQIAHILVIVFILWTIPNIPSIQPEYFTSTWWFEYYQQKNILIYIAGFLFFSYFADIVHLMHLLTHDKKTVYERSYSSMIIQVTIFAVVLVGLISLPMLLLQ